MPLQLITPPSAEPLTLDEAKLHLRVDINDDDALIGALIAAARDYAEGETHKQIVSARWKQVLDSFPGPSLIGIPYGRPYALPGHAIYLQRAPVIRVVSIQYLDMAGVTQTMPDADYTVDYSSEPVRITPVFGKIWPIPLPQIGAVWINFDAGFAAPITADAAAGTISAPGWKPLAVGDAVRLSNGGGELPAPLIPATDYFVQSIVSDGVYKLSETSGGAAVTLTSAGTGQGFVGVVPEGLKAWLKIRLSTLYENREEVAIMNRGTIQALPYVDRLLDAYKTYEF
ncbi:head-tail connector protein [Burkholderia vietnamiensis]|uniref:head-tail connector protein n=1 Tax=Burkholderia vietnamiensis TaxID=60552 RepID=UPI0026513FC5|nr:head-tail connector protein [Burkholderia vietnamiensis]MDN8038565.1 head-tail connector protein [Burkholderia vietnamiensis]HDR9185281.1 phage head-tail connector protein [Burkholderia vietnamiensis]